MDSTVCLIFLKRCNLQLLQSSQQSQRPVDHGTGEWESGLMEAVGGFDDLGLFNGFPVAVVTIECSTWEGSDATGGDDCIDGGSADGYGGADGAGNGDSFSNSIEVGVLYNV